MKVEVKLRNLLSEFLHQRGGKVGGGSSLLEEAGKSNRKHHKRH